jgi:hypothetical protein
MLLVLFLVLALGLFNDAVSTGRYIEWKMVGL